MSTNRRDTGPEAWLAPYVGGSSENVRSTVERYNEDDENEFFRQIVSKPAWSTIGGGEPWQRFGEERKATLSSPPTRVISQAQAESIAKDLSRVRPEERQTALSGMTPEESAAVLAAMDDHDRVDAMTLPGKSGGGLNHTLEDGETGQKEMPGNKFDLPTSFEDKEKDGFESQPAAGVYDETEPESQGTPQKEAEAWNQMPEDMDNRLGSTQRFTHATQAPVPIQGDPVSKMSGPGEDHPDVRGEPSEQDINLQGVEAQRQTRDQARIPHLKLRPEPGASPHKETLPPRELKRLSRERTNFDLSVVTEEMLETYYIKLFQSADKNRDGTKPTYIHTACSPTALFHYSSFWSIFPHSCATLRMYRS